MMLLRQLAYEAKGCDEEQLPVIGAEGPIAFHKVEAVRGNAPIGEASDQPVSPRDAVAPRLCLTRRRLVLCRYLILVSGGLLQRFDARWRGQPYPERRPW